MQVVWVTGAGSGLGERLAINLAVNGAKVILTGRNLKELERVQRICILAWMKAVNWEIFKAFVKGWKRLDVALVFPLDVRDSHVLDAAAASAEGLLDLPIDMLFCNAGVSSRGSILETPGLSVMDTNLWGAVGLAKAVLPSMLDRESGHIVAIAG
ncbi:unnamed protein product, partial [Choristocarpus tenellus]